MARARFVLVSALFLASALSFFPACGGENGSGVAPETRQQEILQELSTFRPPGNDGSSVWMLDVWDSDAGLERLVSFPAGEENAAASFKRIEEVYPLEKDTLDERGHESRGVDLLLAAARAGRCRFMPDHYPEFVSTETAQPDFQVLRVYLQALLRRAEAAERRGDFTDAEECYRAAMICGWHLTSDKSSGLIYITGIIFKFRAAQAYAAYLLRRGRQADVEAAKSYVEHTSMLMRAFLWKANTALSEFDGFACLPTIIRIVREDKEVFWRKEAVVRLGTIRYGVPDVDRKTIRRNLAFEKQADAALSRAASEDPDPTVRRLAIWVAMNVKPPNYAEMRHIFE